MTAPENENIFWFFGSGSFSSGESPRSRWAVDIRHTAASRELSVLKFRGLRGRRQVVVCVGGALGSLDLEDQEGLLRRVMQHRDVHLLQDRLDTPLALAQR